MKPLLAGLGVSAVLTAVGVYWMRALWRDVCAIKWAQL